jgi:antitoxin component of MazEF toxin-antitoxin module
MSKSVKQKKPAKSSVNKKIAGYTSSHEDEEAFFLKEPEVSYTSHIRAIGNSKGVILNTHLIESAKLNPEAEIIIQAKKGIITIEQAKEKTANIDLNSWDKQFRAAIRRGVKPETDLFKGVENKFDSKEW